MKDHYYTDKFLNKTFSVIKKNIDDEDIKTDVLSINLKPQSHTRSNYLKATLKRKDYDKYLDIIMEYFIDHEWYEDCAEVRDYQDKLNKLQNNEQEVTRTKSEPVEAEL